MGHDAKLYVRARDAKTATDLAALGASFEVDGEWLRMDAPTLDAEDLSRQLATPVVDFSIESSVEQIWIRVLDGGALVRELQYDGAGGWRVRSGAPQPFEAAAALARWFEERRISATPAGYDVLECVLGRERPPPREVREASATVSTYLPGPMLAELESIAQEHAVSLSILVRTAWEIGKHALHARLAEAADAPIEGEPILAEADVSIFPEGLVHAPVEVAPIEALEPRVKCQLALPGATNAELERMVALSDRPASWLLREAYLLARPRILHR